MGELRGNHGEIPDFGTIAQKKKSGLIRGIIGFCSFLLLLMVLGTSANNPPTLKRVDENLNKGSDRFLNSH